MGFYTWPLPMSPWRIQVLHGDSQVLSNTDSDIFLFQTSKYKALPLPKAMFPAAFLVLPVAVFTGL